MYNRYIPQPDGTYKRNRVSEPHRQQISSRPPSAETPRFVPNSTPEKENPIPCTPPLPDHSPCACPRKNHNSFEGITGFFRQLLPKELETADLLIIILLLLMAGDCEESRNNALLTLALYFIM